MFKQLQHDEAENLMAQCDDLIIADVRDKDSYEKAHIANAIHLSMATLQEFCEQADKSQPIIVYCYHGVSSQSVAQHLIDHGFTQVYSLVGGFETWKAHHPTSD